MFNIVDALLSVTSAAERALGSMSKPLWQALCEQWVAEHRGNTGLTVPFLVGATQRSNSADLPAQLDQAALAKLLFELQSQCPPNRCVRIEMCGTPEKPVVKVSELTDVQSHGELLKARKGKSRLYVSQTYAHDSTMESAIRALWKVVGPAIASGGFSYNDGKFHPFSSDEEAFIERAKQCCLTHR